MAGGNGKQTGGWLLKRLNAEGTIWLSNSTSRYVPKRTENICQHKNPYKNAHSTLIVKARSGKLVSINIEAESKVSDGMDDSTQS